MKTLKNFADFVKEGVVKKRKPDKSRAKFLLEESEKNYSFLLELLEKIEITDNNANSFIKPCHDLLMEMIRAKMLIDGYNASGFGAHEAEVTYLKEIGFIDKDVQFADQLRYFRNGMLYYGTILDKEYAKQVLDFTKRIYAKLKILIKV